MHVARFVFECMQLREGSQISVGFLMDTLWTCSPQMLTFELYVPYMSSVMKYVLCEVLVSIKAAVLEVHSLKGTDEAALGCSRNMYTQPYITPLRKHW